MKVIMVMYDSLNRRMLPPYGCDFIHAPNFSRLQEHTVTFDNSFVGSMPCMPARRELHTGRYNFLHRSWGPLEPFDDSMPNILKDNGIYSHLITDHYHYWEDGGCTYHTRYSSWEMVRGQEGDPWKGEPGPSKIPDDRIGRKSFYTEKFYANKKYINSDNLPAKQTFDLGLEFIYNNVNQNNWFLQIECFDPHEPFVSAPRHEALYPHDYVGPEFDWPDYAQVKENSGQVKHVRYKYAASLSHCDEQLGRVLDAMDKYNMWEDTMLIVCTDHGILLGEHGWWAKNRAPYFNEVAHTPLFIWDPRCNIKGERRKSVVQMIDIAPTLLEYFDLEIPKNMLGKPLKNTILTDEPIRETALFGLHAAHVCCTDGKYVYMRAPSTEGNEPVYNYTLMPTSISNFFTSKEFSTVELVDPFSFTKGSKVMKMKFFGRPKNIEYGIESYEQGTMLFDHDNDLEQRNNLAGVDTEAEKMMIEKMIRAMQINDCPIEQYDRLGLSAK